MINPSDELVGQLVLIHPGLTGDPAGKSGQVGIITGTELENDNIYVGFGKQGQGLYGTDALLMLRPAEQLKQILQELKPELSFEDYKALFQIALLKEFRPTTANIKTAMSLALQSETVRNYSMRSIEDTLGLRQQQSMER
jgi:hypothetical protein